MNFKALAQRHKAEFEKFLTGAGVVVTIRQPGARVAGTNAVDRVKGQRTFETSIGSTQDILVVWSNDLIRPEAVVAGDVAETIAALGGKASVDVIIRCRLSDALLDGATHQGRTLFDTAKDVTYSGQTYEVTGTKRTGLPPIGPYILWVGLKQIPEER